MKRICLPIVLTLFVMLIASCERTSTPDVRAGDTATAAPSPIMTATSVADPSSSPARASVPTPAGPTGRSSASPTAVALVDPKADPAPPGVFDRTAAVRGLEMNGEVLLATLSPDQLRPYLVAMFEKEHAREEMEKAKALWVILDLIDEQDDLYALWLSLLDEQVMGFYEFESRSMTLVGQGGPLSAKDEVTLAHEYVHALQDQHFDVGPRMKQIRHDGEKSLALQALLEGDATIAMLEYARNNLSPDGLTSLLNDASTLDMRKLQSAPLPLQVNLLFPYQQGARFVGSLFASGGWTAVNSAYASPPVTSEQIIHPEKYLAREGPRRVEMPDVARALGREWSQLDRSAIGELGWIVYFADGLGPEQAGLAAMGWGGDEYVLFRSGSGEHALAVLSTWDTERDATEFFAALYHLQDSWATNEFTLDDASRVVWRRAAGTGYASRKGEQVLLVIAADQPTVEKIAGTFSGF